MENLFAYGQLRDKLTQEKVFGRVIEGNPDVLQDYSLSAIDIQGSTYPIAIPKQGSSIQGEVIEVNPAELKLIDEWETDTYQRTKVTLKSGKQAWVYTASEQVITNYGKLLGL